VRPDDLTQLGQALAVAIGDSLAEFLVGGDPARSHEVLTMLRGWTREGAAHRQTAGVFAFLEIASTLWCERPTADGQTVW
jgi:hypothetical protein